MLAASRGGGMRNADRRNRTDADHSQEWPASTGKPDAWKAGMSGLAEGPTEKGWATSTSPAAYSTWGGGKAETPYLSRQGWPQRRRHRNVSAACDVGNKASCLA